MPLLKGKSHIGDNIKELESTGRSHKQSLAIALKTAGVSKKPGSKLKRAVSMPHPKKEMRGMMTT